MSYNGSGTFQINTSGQPVVTGTSISSTVFNALTADLATGLSTAITKDGQTTTTARIPFALGINSTLVTDATNTTSGSIITAGGVGIAKAVFIGTTLNVAGASTMTGSIAVDSVTDSSSTTTGSIQTDGGVGIAKALYVGTTANVAGIATLTSNPVLSAGTANGVAYLNGSKALTTGSALVFDGTNFSTTGTATATKLIPTGTSVTGNGMFLPTTDTLGFSTAGAEQVRISSSVNGIVTVGPRAASVGGFGTDYATHGVWNSVGGGYRIYRGTGAGTAVCNFYGNGTSVNLFALEASTPLIFGTANTERARIDSTGNVLIGGTSFASIDQNAVLIGVASGRIIHQHDTATASGIAYSVFQYAGSSIGSITQNGTTGVLYNLTSDYRLKNDQQPLTGAKKFVMALQPKKWQWWDGSGEGVGFVAHEFMEVAKYSGHGEKDAVDADGKPVYQSIQPSSSEVMANLVSFIQEQQALITTLTDRITALEARNG